MSYVRQCTVIYNYDLVEPQALKTPTSLMWTPIIMDSSFGPFIMHFLAKEVGFWSFLELLSSSLFVVRVSLVQS